LSVFKNAFPTDNGYFCSTGNLVPRLFTYDRRKYNKHHTIVLILLSQNCFTFEWMNDPWVRAFLVQWRGKAHQLSEPVVSI
jgi:hypothetical protein